MELKNLSERIENIKDMIQNDPEIKRNKDIKSKFKKLKKLKNIHELEEHIEQIERLIDEKSSINGPSF